MAARPLTQAQRLRLRQWYSDGLAAKRPVDRTFSREAVRVEGSIPYEELLERLTAAYPDEQRCEWIRERLEAWKRGRTG